MNSDNQISLFTQSRHIEIKPIDTKKLRPYIDPVQKTFIEYQQFKRTNLPKTIQQKNSILRKKKQLTKSFEKYAKVSTQMLSKLSQSFDHKIKTNQSQLTIKSSDNTILNNEEIHRKGTIYESSSTQIYKIQIEGHFNYYALKISKVGNQNKCTQEVYHLKQLRHPNIIELKHYYVIYDKVNLNTPYLHEVLPLMTCNLKQFIQQFTKYSKEEEILRTPHNRYTFNPQKKKAPQILFKLIIYQIVRAIAYLHSKNITHRDINPRNILMDLDTLSVQICDFNSALILSQSMSYSNQVGECNYRAPELLLGAKSYSPQIDLWSLGCIVAETFLGQPLFNGTNVVETVADIIKLLGTPKPEELRKMKSHIQDLKMPDIPKYPLEKRFRDVEGEHLVEFVEKLLVYDPTKRTSAFELLTHPFFQEIKQPNIKINSKSLPNIFNFTKEELSLQEKNLVTVKLVPDWYLEKQKRFEYLKTSMEDAKLILDK